MNTEKSFNKVIISLIVFVLTQCIFAEILYIDSRAGNDANPGTKEKALSTLGKAASLVNSSHDPGPTVIKILPGIYNLTDSVLFENLRQYTPQKRFIIEASVLPDDLQWNPQLMPVILSTENPRNPANPEAITETYGLKIKISHVTVRGLKFLGSPIQNNMYAPIEHFGEDIEDMHIAQCMFIGDKDTLDIYCPAISNGNKFVVDHCVFHNCHATAVFWDGPQEVVHRDNAMKYCIVDGCYISGVWTCKTADDFEYHHNIVNDTEYFWMRKRQDKPFEYTLSDCIINVKKYSGYGTASGPIGQTGKEINYKETNIIKEAEVVLERDKSSKNYLHPVKNTPGSELGAGLFNKSKRDFKHAQKGGVQ